MIRDDRENDRAKPRELAGYRPDATAGGCKYDPIAAGHAVEFIETFCCHVKGKLSGKPLLLERWQKDIVKTLFGWKLENGNRRYRKAYIEVPRKNGKSTLMAAIGLYMLFCDNEAGAEIYCAASDKDQASLVFNIGAMMIRKAPAMDGRCKVRDSMKRVIFQDSFLRAIPCDVSGAHGYHAHAILADELHAWGSHGHEFWTVLDTSVGAREQPLTVAITTAGYDRRSICWEQHEYARRVRDGVIEDESFLPVLYFAEDDEDWTDPEVWKKANPNLGVSLSLEYMERKCKEAQETPRLENDFRRLHLDQWTQQAVRFLQMKDWRSCGEPLRKLDGMTCFGGLDLSSTKDTTAWVMVFPQPDGTVDVLPRIWVPEGRIDVLEKVDRVPYCQWVRDGFMLTVPGNRIEYSYIRKQIAEDAERYRIKEIGYDPWQAEETRQRLEDDHGLKLVEMRQGFKTLSAPMKDLESRATTGRLRHAGHPVLEWMAECLDAKRDDNRNVRPIKPDGSEAGKKVDGMVALIMALGRSMTVKLPPRSVYSDRGVLKL